MRYFVCALVSAALLMASGELSGRRAPGFSLPDLHVKQHDLEDYHGKIVVLDIIQTKCPHCAAFSEVLEKMHQRYGGKVVVLSIVNPPDTQATVSRYVTEHKISTPVLFDCGQVSVSYLKVTPANPKADVPHVFLIDGQGEIRNDYSFDFDHRNIFEGDALNAEIDRLLAETAPAKSR